MDVGDGFVKMFDAVFLYGIEERCLELRVTALNVLRGRRIAFDVFEKLAENTA